MATRPDYTAEVAYRREVLDALLQPEPAAPVCPSPLWEKDRKGELQETSAYQRWQNEIRAWGAVPSVRANHEIRAAIEAEVYAWICSGVAPDPQATIARLRARFEVLHARSS